MANEALGGCQAFAESQGRRLRRESIARKHAGRVQQASTLPPHVEDLGLDEFVQGTLDLAAAPPPLHGPLEDANLGDRLGSEVHYFVKNGQVSKGFKDLAKYYGIKLFDGNGAPIP